MRYFKLNIRKKPLVSCIYLFDQFEWIDYIPWKISLKSAIDFSDEIIIVRGKRFLDNENLLDLYLMENPNTKVKIVEFDWKQNYSWYDIAHALNYGLLHCTGKWCFRLLMDEIIPPMQFNRVRKILRESYNTKVFQIGRYYMLGIKYLFPYIQRDFFFLNNNGIVFGKVSLNEDMPLLFDSPILINSNKFFIQTPEEYLSLYDSPPQGVRPKKQAQRIIDCFIINTDVNFLPDYQIIKQKKLSESGYLNLPSEYSTRTSILDDEMILNNHMTKLRKMCESETKFWYSFPDELLKFAQTFNYEHNSILNLFSLTL